MTTAPCPPPATPADVPLLDLPSRRRTEEYFWLWVMCLLGLDYFSTLAYQPSITYEVAGQYGPLATLGVVLVTLFGALPVYFYLAGRSPRGQGSLGLLERHVRGWRGKTLVLVLLGFAATDFTMLKAISVADASVHLINDHLAMRKSAVKEVVTWVNAQLPLTEEEQLHPYFDEQLVVTLALGAVGFLFWFLLRKGFNRNVLIVSVPLVFVYLLLNGLLLGAGLLRLYDNPQLVTDWLEQVQSGEGLRHAPAWVHGDWWSIGLLSLLFLPSLALGLSGFELSMIIMPQVKGKAGEPALEPPTRIRNTRKVLFLAACIMAVYLLASVLVTTLLIPGDELISGGGAANRALAYLAHGDTLNDRAEPLLPFCGVVFGTLYDGVTVLILCLAGTSVMTALAVLLPQFLLRFGMEFRWVDRWGLLLAAFAIINIVITLVYQAHVEEQRNAYGTAVLVMISSACVVTVLDKRHRLRTEPHGTLGAILGRFDLGYFGLVAGIFLLTTAWLIVESVIQQNPSGLGISFCFIAAILAVSVVSRAYRADELRTIGFDFKDDESRFLWDSMRLADFPVLVPHRPGLQSREDKEKEIRVHHQLTPEADIVLLEVEVGDASDFYQRVNVEVAREGACVVIRLRNCVSVPHAIAAVALEMSRESRPPSLHFGWTDHDMLSASWNYLAFGEGNIPWKVRELIHRAESDAGKRPRVIVG